MHDACHLMRVSFKPEVNDIFRLPASLIDLIRSAVVNLVWHIDLYVSHLVGLQYAYGCTMSWPLATQRLLPADGALQCRQTLGCVIPLSAVLCLLLLSDVCYRRSKQ